MNKTIFIHRQKVLLAISLFLLATINYSFTPINLNKDKNDDYVLVNKILAKTKKLKSSRILSLNSNNDNEFVISLIDSFYKLEINNQTKKLDSLKQVSGIDEMVYKSVFNKKEHSHYLSQKLKSNWDSAKIEDKSIKVLSKDSKKSSKSLKVYISKPIYSSDKKFCLIYIQSSWSGIMIYKKKNGIWEDYKLISPMFH